MRNFYNFDPTDPTSLFWYDPLPEHPTQEELDLYKRICVKSIVHGFLVFLAVILLLALASLLTGCTTTKEISYAELHRIVTTANRMDSTLMAHTVARQDSTWHQEILRQFQSIREKSDTSHSVTLNAVGDTIRERIVINNIRETSSETDRQQLTVMSHRLEVMDSTVQVQSLQIAQMDSLLRQQKQTEIKEVPKSLNWFQQMQLWLGRMVLVALAVLTGIWLIRKRAWWLRLFLKH